MTVFDILIILGTLVVIVEILRVIVLAIIVVSIMVRPQGALYDNSPTVAWLAPMTVSVRGVGKRSRAKGLVYHGFREPTPILTPLGFPLISLP